MGFFLEVLIGGLLTGVLYSLVALGFVLIFKASGVFNFAQGAMVLMAGLALVQLIQPTYIGLWHFVGIGALVAAVVGLLVLRVARGGTLAAAKGDWRAHLPMLVAVGAGLAGGLLALAGGAKGWPLWIAIPAAIAVMVAVAAPSQPAHR